MSQQDHLYYFALLVPSYQVKAVKTALEHQNVIHKRLKISPQQSSSHFIVPTNIPVAQPNCLTDALSQANYVTSDAPSRLIDLFNSRDNVIHVKEECQVSRADSFFHHQVSSSLKRISTETLTTLSLSHCILLKTLPSSFYVYEPMLLLPARAFAHESWSRLLQTLERSPDEHDAFFSCLARSMKVTHIAIDGPIPFQTPLSAGVDTRVASQNVMRSPTNLQPVFGDFGQHLPAYPVYHPTKDTFREAFWVFTKQNGIYQTWAPRFSMFSAGNVTEKARILNLESVNGAVRYGQEFHQGSAAVDLFAGIGYFAFSYAKAGVQKLLCWDINPWSVEALCRGAKLNKWGAQVMPLSENQPQRKGDSDSSWQGTLRFLVFNESNIHAKCRILQMRPFLPPIRHISCGMLPSANPAWETAVEAVDPTLGGWVHLHETTRDTEASTRAKDILTKISEYFNDIRTDTVNSGDQSPRLDRIEKVKSMGPKLIHVVLDIWIPPR